MTDFTYGIFFDPNATVPTDITDFAERIEWNEVGTGQVRNATIRLNAQDGAFITNKDFTGTDKTPILKQFDQINISVTDRLGNLKINIFEVDILKPIQNAQQGTILEVQMLGLENQLMKVNFAKPFFLQGGSSGFTTTRDIVDFYNDGDSKGGLQPVVIGNKNDFDNSSGGLLGFNELPVWTSNEYHFELTEQSAYDGLVQVALRLGSSVSAGGAGDFFEIYFETDTQDGTQLLFKGFISGNPPTQQTNGVFDESKAITIDDTVAVNPGEEEGGIESIKGNVVGTWGADGVGTLPRLNARFQGALEFYPNYPFSQDDVLYPKDSIVQIDVQGVDDFNEHYLADVDTETNPATDPTDWTLMTFNSYLDFIGAIQNYTVWTQGLANAWKNCGANVDGQTEQDPPTFDSLAVWDSNLVVIDGTFSRTWVHTAEVDSTQIKSQLLYGGQFFYRGFRVLVNGTAPDTPGNIFFGAGFDNKIIQFNGSNFDVFRDPEDDAFCADDDEAVVYQKQSGLWVDVSTTLDKGNDCYHPVYSIGTDQGHVNTTNALGGNYGEVAGITYEYRFKKTDLVSGTDDIYYRIYVGANFQIPFPPNSFNFQTIGDFYGSNATKREPTTIDVTNMHLSSDGKVGFNHSFAEDLGPLDAVTFFLKFLWKYNFDGSGNPVRDANFPFRCTMYDTSDNVVIQDFSIPFNGEWTPINLPITGFQIYRGRKPVSVEDLGSNIFLQQLEILQVFEYHNIQKITIHWLGAYDNEGRYNPLSALSTLFRDPLGLGVNDYNVKLTIDSFQFSKAGLAISPPNTNDRAIQPRFYDEPLISNFIQLQQANTAHLETADFQQTRFDTVTEGLFDINFGDSYFLENTFIVNNADRGASPPNANNGDPNTIKLVAKGINYVIDKRPNVPGGFLRTIEGAKRIE